MSLHMTDFNSFSLTLRRSLPPVHAHYKWSKTWRGGGGGKRPVGMPSLVSSPPITAIVDNVIHTASDDSCGGNEARVGLLLQEC